MNIREHLRFENSGVVNVPRLAVMVAGAVVLALIVGGAL